MNSLRVFTAVWGRKYIDWFDRACVCSLAWPKNRAALIGATWCIYTAEDDKEAVEKIAGRVGIKVEVEILSRLGGFNHVILDALVREIKKCLANSASLLLFPPDTIFGDGTIKTLIELGQWSSSVAVPHMRVDENILEEVSYDVSETNASLVFKALHHAHKSWTEAELGNKATNTPIGGIAWQRICENMVAVKHHLPTIYLANFTAGDLAFFHRVPDFTAWDHSWSGKLVKENRYRVVGSSDAAFMCELTEADKNVPLLSEPKPGEPDFYVGREEHHIINKNFWSIFRGE
jgi:hypothetical protein